MLKKRNYLIYKLTKRFNLAEKEKKDIFVFSFLIKNTLKISIELILKFYF